VGTIFIGGKFRTSILLITRRHSLSLSSFTCTALFSPCDKPTLKKGTIQAYHVPSV